MSGSKGSDHWRLCDEFSVVEAAHLITDPSSIDSKIKPPGYEAA